MAGSSLTIEQKARAEESTRKTFPSLLSSDAKGLALVVVSAVLVLVPVMIWGIPSGADLVNHYRFAVPFFDSLQQGNLQPGWLAESNGGYGDPRLRFYPPALYVLLAAIHSVASWYWASITSFVVLSTLGGLGVYLWTRAYVSPTYATFAAICYAFVPYRLNEIYQASLLAEYFASAVLPFVFAFIVRLCRKSRPIDMAGLAMSYALLVLSNLPLAVIGSLSALFFAFLQLDKDRLFKQVAVLAVSVILGLGLSAFFWVGMISELSWIKGNDVSSNVYYDYRVNFLFSPAALVNRNTWYANVLALALLAFLAPAVFVIGRKMRKEVKAVLALVLFSFLMATPLSRPLWAVIPKLSQTQFPWRWLAVTSLAASVLVGLSFDKWVNVSKTRLRPLTLLPTLLFAGSLLFVATQIVWDTKYLNKQAFDALLPKIHEAASFKDWLPVNARNFIELPKMSSKVEAESRNVEIEAWNPELRRFEVAAGPSTTARIKTYYYPSWTATVNGNPIVVDSDANGVIQINVPEVQSTVEMKFGAPRYANASRTISALCMVLLGILMLGNFLFRKTRSSL
jgi:hypothetical protein